MSGEPKTLVQAMNELSAAFKEVQHVIGEQVLPPLVRLNEQFVLFGRQLFGRQLYLARLKRWLPWVAFVFLACVLIGWWIT